MPKDKNEVIEKEMKDDESVSTSDDESSSENESEEDIADDQIMEAIREAMMNTIVLSISVEDDEDDDEDWEPEDDESDGSETSDESSNEMSEKRNKKTKSVSNKKKQTKKQLLGESEDEEPTPPPAPRASRKSKEIAKRRIREKAEKEKKTKTAENGKQEDNKQDVVSKLSRKVPSNKKSKQSNSKTKTIDSSMNETTPEKDNEFDFEKAMEEFKKVMKTKEGIPTLMKTQFETLEEEYKKREEKKAKKERRKKLVKYSKDFRELLRKKNTESDISFFRKLPLDKQEQYLTEFRRLKDASSIKKPYTIKLLESPIPVEFKSIAFKKVLMLEQMEPGFGEYFKIKQWVDTFMQIPFGVNHTLPVSLEQDGVEKCNEFMSNAKNILDKSVYGLNDAKMQIMQLLGQLMTNPSSVGTAIAIKGCMGTGKTTLVKEGISKVLGRPFVFIPLGGATDSSFLEGHSYTYEGSTWGRIVDAIVQCKCMNPVFYFDELDKVSKTPHGDEIIGILTHLTDTTQNSQYHDKYFADLDFDLSKALFIFSYNHEENVNPILRDRMYCIETKGYEKKDKIVIARKYLIPKIVENVRFTQNDIEITDETLENLIDNHTDDEKGVRNLKRCLETIYTKLNLYRLMPKGCRLFEDEDDMSLDVSFPYVVNVDAVKKLLRKGEEKQSFMSMYL